MAENDTWEKEEDLEHARELVDEFKGRISTEIRRQEGIKQKGKRKLNPRADEYKEIELLGKYIAKLLYGWDNGKFEKEYLKKLERNWQKWKSVSLEEKS